MAFNRDLPVAFALCAGSGNIDFAVESCAVGEVGVVPELLSFAAITDEPPEEVSAAGLDRCIIPIKPEHLDAWLSPDPSNLDALQAILDDRTRPYYEHRWLLAA